VIFRPGPAYRTRVEFFDVRQVKPKNRYIDVFLMEKITRFDYKIWDEQYSEVFRFVKLEIPIVNGLHIRKFRS
jgi:hypothetical protein